MSGESSVHQNAVGSRWPCWHSLLSVHCCWSISVITSLSFKEGINRNLPLHPHLVKPFLLLPVAKKIYAPLSCMQSHFAPSTLSSASQPHFYRVSDLPVVNDEAVSDTGVVFGSPDFVLCLECKMMPYLIKTALLLLKINLSS